MTYYYYTRWKFKTPVDDLGVGPFHSTWESLSDPVEFLADIDTKNTREFFFREFDSKEEMERYWAKVDRPVEVRLAFNEKLEEEQRRDNSHLPLPIGPPPNNGFCIETPITYVLPPPEGVEENCRKVIEVINSIPPPIVAPVKDCEFCGGECRLKNA